MVYKNKNYLSLTNITHTFSKPCVRFSTFNGFLVMTGSINHSGHGILGGGMVYHSTALADIMADSNAHGDSGYVPLNVLPVRTYV